MRYRRIGITALAAAALITGLPAAADEPRAVLELFTSQGCSSCPPADRLLGELQQDPSLITMSLAVDYWDYLGWKDTLALHGHSDRQRAYAHARSDREVYTPQVVVNGVMHVLGSDRAAIERAITQTRRTAAPLSLPLKLAIVGDTLTVNVSAANDNRGSGEVWLCPIIKEVPVAIGRGENHGRKLTYHNVVRRWVKLGDWMGKAETFSMPMADVATGEIDSIAVVVQSGVAANPGVMLGAAVASIR